MTKRTNSRRWLAIALASATLGGVPWSGGTEPVSGSATLAQESDAERTYRDARRALTREQFSRAAETFAVLRDRFPASAYIADSYYWQAFSLYRLDALREALGLLESQLTYHPDASTAGDARDLELRIRNRLARRGDATAAERAMVLAEATLAAEAVGGLDYALAGAGYAYEHALAQSARASEIGHRRAEAALAAVHAQGFVGDTRFQEGCDEEEVQQAALQALMQMDTDRALPILERVLARRDECSVPLRKQAIFVLSQHDAAVAESVITDVALNDPEPEVQEAAVFWLSQVGTDGALDALTQILMGSDDERLQENAIFALSQHGSSRAGELLREYALDATRPQRIREKAIFWLSQHPEQADADFLIQLYGQLESESLRESVFFSLAQLDDAAAVEWMLDRALDASEPVELRKQALFWAGQHASIDLDRLNGLYGRLEDAEMKGQLIFTYAQRDEPEAVDRLIEIARIETDPEIRKRVIFWLGQTGDERAIEYLLDLVEDPPR